MLPVNTFHFHYEDKDGREMIGYIRVSTDKSELESQRYLQLEHVWRRHIHCTAVIKVMVS